MKTDERSKMIEDLMTTEKADEMDFVITRDHPKPGETFSKEYLAEFQQSILDFINARIVYHWTGRPETEPGPSNMRVEVKVTIDDKNYPPLNKDRPWFVIDGTKRAVDA